MKALGLQTRNVTSKTFLSGISDLMGVMSDPDRYGEAYIQRLAGSAVPTLSAQIARVEDPVLRDARSILDQVKSRIPGYSKDLPPRRNLWGEPIVLSGGIGPDIMSPIYSRSAKADPVNAEILRLGVRLDMPTRSVGGVELTPAEYSEYVRLAGNGTKDPDTGLGAKDTIAAIIAGRHPLSEQYARASDGPDGGKALLIRRIVSAFREAARGELRERFPDLGERLDDLRLNELSALQGR